MLMFTINTDMQFNYLFGSYILLDKTEVELVKYTTLISSTNFKHMIWLNLILIKNKNNTIFLVLINFLKI